MSLKHTLEETKTLFAELGFELLSTTYEANNKRLQARCSVGHEFSISRSNAQNGRGCPHCSQKARITPEWVETIAKAKGGRLLRALTPGESLVKGRMQPLRYHAYVFACANSHVFERQAAHIKRGAWCPFCADEASLAVMRARATERGGAVLGYTRKRRGDGTEGRFSRVHLRGVTFRCGADHLFSLTSKEVDAGSWCPLCEPAYKS